MNLILTSNFPSNPSEEVVARIQAASPNPQIAWVAPLSAARWAHFLVARLAFRAIGVKHLELIDLAAPTVGKPSLMRDFNVVYLTGGNPLQFRDDLKRSGFHSYLRAFAAAGGLIVGASGGAMQITPNLSLYRLLTVGVDEVVRTRNEYEGLALATFEILPHLNKHDARFLSKARKYSEGIEAEIVAVEDGGVLVVRDQNLECFGRAVVFHRGIEKRLENTF